MKNYLIDELKEKFREHQDNYCIIMTIFNIKFNIITNTV